MRCHLPHIIGSDATPQPLCPKENSCGWKYSVLWDQNETKTRVFSAHYKSSQLLRACITPPSSLRPENLSMKKYFIKYFMFNEMCANEWMFHKKISHKFSITWNLQMIKNNEDESITCNNWFEMALLLTGHEKMKRSHYNLLAKVIKPVTKDERLNYMKEVPTNGFETR